MHLVLTVAVFGTAVVTAVRSTWSPCGRSMLSTITPIGERARGTRYATSVAWFVTGAVAGGASLGGVLAGLSAAVGVAAAPSDVLLAALLAGAGAVAAASDARLGGFQLPFHRRQVNEMWLDRFRPWVYGAGFGWQIGVGFATYVMSAGLYLMVVLAALQAQPAVAVTVGVVFGAVRGLAVLLGRRLTDPEALRIFHRRFDAAGRSVERAVICWELALCAAGLAALSVRASVVAVPVSVTVAVLGAAAVAVLLAAAARASSGRPVRPRVASPGDRAG